MNIFKELAYLVTSNIHVDLTLHEDVATNTSNTMYRGPVMLVP